MFKGDQVRAAPGEESFPISAIAFPHAINLQNQVARRVEKLDLRKTKLFLLNMQRKLKTNITRAQTRNPTKNNTIYREQFKILSKLHT